MQDVNAMVQEGLEKIAGDVKAFANGQRERTKELATKQEELQARLQDVEQKQDRRIPGSSSGASGPSLGRQVEAEFRLNAPMFAKTRMITLNVQAAITSTAAGGHGSLAVPNAPAQVSTQLAGMLAPGPLEGLQTLHYARRTGTIGGAAAQDDEGAAKANAEAVFTSITQNAITVAGYANVSEQALASPNGLARAIDSHLAKSVRDALDAILVSGTVATGWPFAGFVALAAPFAGPATYLSLVDAILAGALRMHLQGFNPTIAILSEAGFLATQLAKDSTGQYLADNYLADLSLAIGGMRVGLSAGIPAGKALLIDPAFCGFLGSGETKVTIGFVDQQFYKNMCTVRGETQVIPYFTDFLGAQLVTPAAA